MFKKLTVLVNTVQIFKLLRGTNLIHKVIPREIKPIQNKNNI